MNMTCIACSRDVNLDHMVFENYDGPVKCFSCGTMMEIRTEGGVLNSVAPQGCAVLFPENPGVFSAG